MQDLNYSLQKNPEDLLFSIALIVRAFQRRRRAPVTERPVSHPLFLALLRRPLWKGLMALWDKPPSANNRRSKVKLNSEE